jgi:chaperone modulatory protein CbpM
VDFGVNDEGVGVILNLVDQLYGMRRTLMELRQAVRPASEQD